MEKSLSILIFLEFRVILTIHRAILDSRTINK